MSYLLRRAIQQSLSGSVAAVNFKTSLYTGTATDQDIITDLDFIANDGLVWIKNRDTALSHNLFDTLRGSDKYLESDLADAEGTATNRITSFNDDGFSVRNNNHTNENGSDFVAWQFMKAQGFFDVVEYVGDGIAGRTVAIDLDDGSAVFGMAIVKRLDSASNWSVQHISLGGTHFLQLNTTNSAEPNIIFWNDTDATSNTLTLGNDNGVNALNSPYIAYLFAHNPTKGIFCGSYTGTSAAGNQQVTGFPVGWVLIKDTASFNWVILDTSRVSGSLDGTLFPNSTTVETLNADVITYENDGFTPITNAYNNNGANYIFMALADPSLF